MGFNFGLDTGDTAIGGGSVTAHRHDGLYQNFRIKFMNVPTGLSTDFAAIITEFNDRHESSWDEKEYYGRMDPVAKFKNTKRTINFAFSVINDDPHEAATNMVRYQKLVKMLYPVYKRAKDASVNPFQTSDASTISSPPLMGIKFANLISSAGGTSVPGDYLVGRVDGFEFTPDNDASYWHVAGGMDDQEWETMDFGSWSFSHPVGDKPVGNSMDGQILLPRKFDITVSFHVMHTHPLGFNEDGGGFNELDYPHRSENLVNSFAPNLKEKVEIEYSHNIKEAVVPLSIKKNGWAKLADALFGPPW